MKFYNLLLKEPSSFNGEIHLTNVPEDINIMLNTVSRTQHKVVKTIPETACVQSFKTVDEFMKYMSGIAF